MKHLKLLLIAIILTTALALTNLAPAVGHAQSDKQPPAGQQQKPDPKKQKSEEVEGQDDQAIRLGTQLVTVPFAITDKKNRYINDLTKEDLEVLEDNKAQPIFSFERQTDLPITVAMLIDISGSMEYILPMAKAAGQRFFEKVLRPKKDLGAVATFEHQAELVQNLTDNLDKLQRGLSEVTIGTPASVISRAGTPPINNSGAGSTAMYDAIYSVSSDLLAREAGRRVIILITDGIDTSSRVKMKEAIERTWRSEIIIYAIGVGDPGYGGIAEGTLKKIVAETGGRAFFPRNQEDLDKAFAQIDEDLRSQYVLAYEPTNEVRDGSFRTIQVKAKNRKELTIRHRRGYFAPKQS